MTTESFRPADAAELVEIVAASAAAGRSLAVAAGGSKAGLGRPVDAAARLELGALTGIVDYQPEELMLTARPATPLAEVAALLAGRGQMLAFEPPGLAALCGAPDAVPTLGGTVAAGLAGPRRIRAGSARDHLLGLEAVSGRGERFKAGAKVVKNVTGYDLPKLIAGSFGTLALMTEMTLKVLPAPEDAVTLVLPMAAAPAVAAMARLQAGPLEPTALSWLPAALARAADLPETRDGLLLVRFEGPDGALADRFGRAEDSGLGACEAVLDLAHSQKLWSWIAEVVPILAPEAEEVVWRLSVPPAAGAALLYDAVAGVGARGFIDWGGGLVWLAVPAEAGDDGGATALRALVARHGGGHATLMRGPEPLRRRVPGFEPEAPGLAALSERVRQGFDPLRLLNPGRMRGEETRP
ncbi:FAD-binding protein [Tistrella sp.]|uniref:FAD-binding protein n=1 Tax=Tistrella sp. TaxID=2024861 RepID=UPI000C901E55|nr:FAD-binding protein [Tistrella sp.]MAD36124.1 glycolate oxidase, subunit glcE [Tistrella sp.]